MAECALLKDMIKGWFIGPFEPSVWKTDQFECAVKKYRAGDKEAAHVHKVATEFTIVAQGSVLMNGQVYPAESIIKVLAGETTNFEALEDCITFVVKVPAVLGDKYSIESD